jgi:cyclic pyranopterin phosphate synthase
MSVTDRCDLRCSYCRPSARQVWFTPSLSTAQRVRLIAFLTGECGLEQVRFTGGEPLLAPDLIELVDATRALAPEVDIALTTNGQRLGRLAEPLRAAGLNRLNVSLDTLDPQRYHTLTGGELGPVLEGIQTAGAVGLERIKINTVVLRGVNEHELERLVEWSASRGYEQRFLEAMPIGPAADFNRRHFVSQAQVLDRLARHYEVADEGRTAGSTARMFTLSRNGQTRRAGIVAPVSQPFCGDCGRIRLTADGRLFPCLLDPRSIDLAPHLQADLDSEVLRDVLHAALRTKAPAGSTQTSPMVQLGG